MAGHSKWANTKHRKARVDAKRGKIFTKLIRQITVAARMGGGDVDSNPTLRAAVEKAYLANMKKDSVEKAIAKGTGAHEGEHYEALRYEGYGPHGIAVIVDCLTDNKQRTVGEVRHAFSKKGGNLGTDGSVAYMFKHQGVISFDPGVDEDKIMEIALDSGAQDVQTHDDGSVDVITEQGDFFAVKDALAAAGFESVHADVVFEAEIKPELDLAQTQEVMALIDMLEDLDDVQEVHTNLGMSADVEAALNAED